MRKIIAALIVSVDGFIEGPNGELDWVETWEDPFDILPQIDTCILGRGMYPVYEQYWQAVLANPEGIVPLTGKTPSKGEIEYARFAEKTGAPCVEVSWDQAARVGHGPSDLQHLSRRGHAAGAGCYVGLRIRTIRYG